MFAQGVGQGACFPDEHTAVPEEIARLYELFSDLDRGLFSEASNLQHAFLRLASSLDVAVAGFGARRLNADDDDVRSFRAISAARRMSSRKRFSSAIT